MKSVILLLFCTVLHTNILQAQTSSENAISPGDVVSIEIRNLGQVEYDLDKIRVPNTGFISVPLLGDIKVSGLSTDVLEETLKRKLLDGYLRRPEVTVNVDQFRPVYVRGAVNRPGAFPYQDGLTVEKAITLAGGLTELAMKEGVSITTGNGEIRSGDSTSFSTRLQPGVIVTIPEADPAEIAEDATRYFYAYGEVRSPGSYEYRRGLTVEKAIALAGGFTARASKRKISIRRETGNDALETIKNAKLNISIDPGDVITVGQRFF